MKYVIAGTGRSGTGYMAKLLTANGVKCGHERVFTTKGRLPFRNYQADSSWLAVPQLRHLDGQCKVIHSVRDAAAVLRSWFFDWPSIFNMEGRHRINQHAKYLYSHYPDVREEKEPQDQALLYYIMCNGLCEVFSDFFFRVEDSPSELLQYLGVEGKPRYVGTKVNTRDKKRKTRRDAIEAAKTSRFYPDFAEMYERYYPGALQDLQ